VSPAGTVSPAVTYGLLLAWAAHDLEEVLTFGSWTRAAVPRLRERFPQIPDRLWRTLESTDEREFAIAVAIVGTCMATAAAAGQRSGGRSRYFQLMLAGFGLHAVGHLASAAGTRGYTRRGDVAAHRSAVLGLGDTRAQRRRRLAANLGQRRRAGNRLGAGGSRRFQRNRPRVASAGAPKISTGPAPAGRGLGPQRAIRPAAGGTAASCPR
jgi:hypothetical protein